MKLLLDTHALLWWAADDKRLSRPAKQAIALAGPDGSVYVSAATAWEIATKVRIGKLEWPAHLGTVTSYVVSQGFNTLGIAFSHAERAGEMAMAHNDPFDRMLIAQAQADDLLLVSNEKLFDAVGVRRLW